MYSWKRHRRIFILSKSCTLQKNNDTNILKTNRLSNWTVSNLNGQDSIVCNLFSRRTTVQRRKVREKKWHKHLQRPTKQGIERLLIWRATTAGLNIFFPFLYMHYKKKNASDNKYLLKTNRPRNSNLQIWGATTAG